MVMSIYILKKNLIVMIRIFWKINPNLIVAMDIIWDHLKQKTHEAREK